MSEPPFDENPFAIDDTSEEVPIKGVTLPLEFTGEYEIHDIVSVRTFQNPVQLLTDSPVTVKITEEFIEFSNKLGQTRYSWKNTKSVSVIGTCIVIQCGSFHGSLVIPKHWCPQDLSDPIIKRIKKIIKNRDQLADFEIPNVEIPTGAFKLKRKLVTLREQFVHSKIFTPHLPARVYVRGVIGIAMGIAMFQVDHIFDLVGLPHGRPFLLLLNTLVLGMVGFMLAIPFLAHFVIRNLVSPPLFLVIMIYFKAFPPKIDSGPCWFEDQKSCLFTKYVQSISSWTEFDSVNLHPHVVCLFSPNMLKCIYQSQFENQRDWLKFVEFVKGKIPNRMTIKEFHHLNPIVTTKELKAMQRKVREDQR